MFSTRYHLGYLNLGPIKRNLYRSNSENSSEIRMDTDKIADVMVPSLTEKYEKLDKSIVMNLRI